jgi:pimeloyl-ACP methyl ester carboxylesterase
MARAAAKTSVSDARLSWLRYRLLETDPANLIGICRVLAREPDRVAELAATSLPLLVLCGEHDDGWLPRTQMDMARRLSAEAVIIKRAGHTPNEDQPMDTAEALLQFWRAVDAVTQ